MLSFQAPPDSDSIRKIESTLFKDEILLWTGAPNRVFRYPRTRSMTLKSSLLPWVVSIVVILVLFPKILGNGWWWVILLIAAPIILILMSMYVIEPIRRANKYYAITNRRAIIITRHGEQEPRSVPLNAIASFELTHDFTGAGSIDCYVPGYPDFDIVSNNGYNHGPGPLFEYIADPSTVLALLERQAPNATSS